MAEFPVFEMESEAENAEELLAELLEDLAEASGIPFEEIMASEFEEPAEPEPEFWTGEIGERELEEAEQEFELDNDYSADSGDYLEALMDDLDVDPGDEDLYTED